MILLPEARFSGLSRDGLPNGPGAMVTRHVLATGCGEIRVDRFPVPGVFYSRSGNNLALDGDPGAVTPAELAGLVEFGMLAALPDFLPLLEQAFESVLPWDRVVFSQPVPASAAQMSGYEIRRLAAGDAAAVADYDPEGRWIWNTWQTPGRLAASGFAWGAFSGRSLVSIACSFFVGDDFEDIGVVTDGAHTGRGLSSACVAHLCSDIRARGRLPSWTTSPDNAASRRVAEKNGFRLVREDVLYVINSEIPD